LEKGGAGGAFQERQPKPCKKITHRKDPSQNGFKKRMRGIFLRGAALWLLPLACPFYYCGGQF
jgi:hypothetical protein